MIPKLKYPNKSHPAWNKGLQSPMRGIPRSLDTKLKISKSEKGKIVSIETREKLHAINLGKKHSIETCKKISSSHKGLNTWSKGRSAWNKGITGIGGWKLTEEQKLQRSISVKKSWESSSRKEAHIEVLKRQKYKDTKIEIFIESQLIINKIKYEKQIAIAGILVDFYIPSKRLVIECDGCYWHGCPEHFPNEEKQERDRKKNFRLSQEDIKVIRLFECDIEEYATNTNRASKNNKSRQILQNLCAN